MSCITAEQWSRKHTVQSAEPLIKKPESSLSLARSPISALVPTCRAVTEALWPRNKRTPDDPRFKPAPETGSKFGAGRFLLVSLLSAKMEMTQWSTHCNQPHKLAGMKRQNIKRRLRSAMSKKIASLKWRQLLEQGSNRTPAPLCSNI
jgi:hypothetical protein